MLRYNNINSFRGSCMVTAIKDYTKFIGLFTALLVMLSRPVWAETNKPNILIIWGDDVGMWNISAYHRGMMGGTSDSQTHRVAMTWSSIL